MAKQARAKLREGLADAEGSVNNLVNQVVEETDTRLNVDALKQAARRYTRKMKKGRRLRPPASQQPCFLCGATLDLPACSRVLDSAVKQGLGFLLPQGFLDTEMTVHPTCRAFLEKKGEGQEPEEGAASGGEEGAMLEEKPGDDASENNATRYVYCGWPYVCQI
jgi:hypothetical protein